MTLDDGLEGVAQDGDFGREDVEQLAVVEFRVLEHIQF